MSSTTISSSSSSSNISATNYRVNYSDYVANITNSPKSNRKLPSVGVEHHINSVSNTNTIRGNQNIKTTINMPNYGGGTEKCARCSKSVYLAERKMGAGRPFHSSCFNCYNCHRKLETATLSEHKGEIFCKSCYTKQFGAHGLISGVSVSTETHVREQRTARRSSFGSDLDAPIINYQESRYRANSSDNLLREDYDKPIRRESNQQPSRTIEVKYESQTSTIRKPSEGIVVVDTTFRRPSSPIRVERNTNENNFKPIPNRTDDRTRRSSQSDDLSPSRGTSAFVEIPVVIHPRRDQSILGQIDLPTAPLRDNQSDRSRSASPSTVSNNSFQRQNSRNDDKSMTDSYSRFTANDSIFSTTPRSPSNTAGIVKIAPENPLISDSYHQSSTSSATYERKYQSSTSSSSTYNREAIRSRDSSPVNSIIARRSPSPTGSYNSSSTMRTSTTSYREGNKDISSSPTSAFTVRPEYRDSVSTNTSTAGRRSPSPTRSASALNEFIQKTNLADNSSKNTTEKFSALRALAKPRTNDGSDDEFDS